MAGLENLLRQYFKDFNCECQYARFLFLEHAPRGNGKPPSKISTAQDVHKKASSNRRRFTLIAAGAMIALSRYCSLIASSCPAEIGVLLMLYDFVTS